MLQPSPSQPLVGPPVAGQDTWIADVLHAARAGDREALSRLVVEFTPVLWQVARSAGLDQSRREDVVQTTWLRLLGSIDEIRNPATLVGWLVTVTRREAWRVSGADRREQPTGALPGEEPDPAPGPGERLVVRERDRVLWEAVQRLTPRCRELLRVVAFVPRPDYAAVSAALGMPVGSIGPTRGRCLAKLRLLLTTDPRWSQP
jgi:RNA polymerase sigma factor (sigma-70 family)